MQPATTPRLIQIQASAGSGKTYALTSRYLEALAAITTHSPDKMALGASGILAVTFTNAAANEMRERIIRSLKEIALDLPGKHQASLTRKRATEWLNIFLYDTSALNIRTIDSLLHQIIHASALELGLAPDYEVVFDPAEDLAPVFEESLNNVVWDSRGREYMFHACKAFMDKRALGFGKGDVVVKNIESLLKEALLGTYRSIIPWCLYPQLEKDLDARICVSAERLWNAAATHGLKWAPGKEKIIKSYMENGECGKSIPKAIKEFDCAALFGKGEVPAAVEEKYKALYAAIWEKQIFKVYLDDSYSFIYLIYFAELVARDFLNRQRKTGKLLQALVPAYASMALKPGTGVSTTLCRMGTTLHTALIDEFQDTSQEQWAALHPLILDALSRGGSMTWVGDVKQSIYGWRGGDANLFKAPYFDEEFINVAPGPKQEFLTINRRSRKAIVEHNNRFFAPLGEAGAARKILLGMLPNDPPPQLVDEETEILAESYRDVKQHVWDRKDEGGFVSFQLLASADANSVREEGAAKTFELLETNIRGRRAWSDVLVLVRDGYDAQPVVEALTRANIPVITENGLMLAQNGLVAEIVAFLEFLNDPGNDVSLWFFLNGQIMAKMPEAAALQGLASMLLPGKDTGPLYKRLMERFPKAWERLFEPFYDQTGLQTAYDLVREFYRRFSLEGHFPREVTMLGRFLEFCHNRECDGILSLPDFLRSWQIHGAQEKAPIPEKMNAVRIMTIHKAKGLQAPVVIIPSTRFRLRPPSMPVMEKVQNELLPVKSTKELGISHYRRMAAQAREALNLLYVAMTRAEEELYIFHAPRQAGTQKTLDNGIRIILEKAGFAPDYTMGELAELECKADACACAQSGEKIFQEPVFEPDWRPMLWRPAIKIFRNQLRPNTLTANERGVLVHAALERLNFALPPRDGSRIALEMAAKLLGMKLEPDSFEELADSLGWYAGLPEAARWREHGFTEHSLMLPDGALVRPDLIIPTPEGPVVIDYKTGQAHASHVEQVKRYMDVLKASGQFSGEPRGCLVYFDLQRFQLLDGQGAGHLQKDAPNFF